MNYLINIFENFFHLFIFLFYRSEMHVLNKQIYLIVIDNCIKLFLINFIRLIRIDLCLKYVLNG